jgi:hypothetical protein
MAQPERRRWEETMSTSVQGRASAVMAGAGLGVAFASFLILGGWLLLELY